MSAILSRSQCVKISRNKMGSLQALSFFCTTLKVSFWICVRFLIKSFTTKNGRKKWNSFSVPLLNSWTIFIYKPGSNPQMPDLNASSFIQWHTPCCNWPPSVLWDQMARQSWSPSHATDVSKRLREWDAEQVSKVDWFVMDGISSYFVDITLDMPSNHNVLNNMISKPSHWWQKRIFQNLKMNTTQMA